MAKTVYVVESNPDERKWIESVLERSVEAVVFVDDGATLLAHPPPCEGGCVIASAEPDEAATLKLVRTLRSQGVRVPVIVLGPHSAFRTAVDLARLEATDFLERPVSARQLRAAVQKSASGLTDRR